MNLIILTAIDRVSENSYRLSDHRAEHIRKILKSKIGDTIRVGILNGATGLARIDHISDDYVDLTCGSLVTLAEPRVEVDIICALPRPQTLKKVLLIASMMRVRRLYLIRANRVEKSYFHSPTLLPENREQHLVEGLCQGGFTRLPQVSVHDRFRRFFEDEFGLDDASSLKLLPAIEYESSIEGLIPQNCNNVVVAIGPEGGWVPFEEELMRECGFMPFGLGPWILRVEHAVTAALSQIELACK